MEIEANEAYGYDQTILDDSSTDRETTALENRVDSEINDLNNQQVTTPAMDDTNSEKQSAIWTTTATRTLLKNYEDKLEMLVTPKKKTRIWIAIAENLKEYNVEVTADQVRWKINALAKRYKLCIDSGYKKFKYFKEMDNIYAKYNVDCDSFTIQNGEILQKRNRICHQLSTENISGTSVKRCTESKAMIELRKKRLASRIEADRSQSKINLEKEWLEYLRRQEEEKKIRDEVYERNLKLREEELELRKRELEVNKSLELKKIEIIERDQEELLQVERAKFEMLKKIFSVELNGF